MPTPKFGGSWTERKLEVLRRYLDVYAKALRRQSFRRIYVDAFAGTGERTARQVADSVLLEIPELESVKKGSARLALEVEPPFDQYLLIEKGFRRATQLTSLTGQYPDRSISIINKDANVAIADICKTMNWRAARGVVFLDPFGLQVSWTTLEALAKTKSVDVWVLVPTGIGLQRLLKRDGKIPREWQETLDRFLGTEVWRTEFYRTEENVDLLGDPVVENVRDASSDKLERFVIERLRTIFPTVLEQGVALANTRGQRMYLLCFASANHSRAVKELALKLASWAARA